MTKSMIVIPLLLSLQMLRSEPPSPFAGQWEGEFHKTVYTRLVIHDGSPVSGRLASGRVDTYDDGSLKDAMEAEGAGDPIEHVSVVDGRLTFAANGDRLVLRLIDDSTAELSFTDLPEGTKLKPFVLKKK